MLLPMTLLYWGILIVLTVSAWKNWKGTVIVWMPLSMLFNECVCLKYTPPRCNIKVSSGFHAIMLVLSEGNLSDRCKGGIYFKKSFYSIFGILWHFDDFLNYAS